MKHTPRIRQTAAFFSAALALAVFGVGCPLLGGNHLSHGTGKLTTVITADASPLKTMAEFYLLKQGGGPIPLDQIESLIVTVTKIELLRDDDDEENGEENGDDKNHSGHVVVFEGSVDVDLMDLVGVSEVLSSAEVPADTYKRIILSISNPRLVLASDPETEITNVQLTANGRLFVKGTFTIEDGESRILQLDLGGIHLVQAGASGMFVLTPQLKATVNLVTLEEVVVVGDIISVDPENDSFELDIFDGVVTVVYTDAVIFLPFEMEPTGTPDDLVVGLAVDVEGTLHMDGSVAATQIRIFAN